MLLLWFFLEFMYNNKWSFSLKIFLNDENSIFVDILGVFINVIILSADKMTYLCPFYSYTFILVSNNKSLPYSIYYRIEHNINLWFILVTGLKNHISPFWPQLCAVYKGGLHLVGFSGPTQKGGVDVDKHHQMLVLKKCGYGYKV